MPGEPVVIRKEFLGTRLDLGNVDIGASELPDVIGRIPEGNGKSCSEGNTVSATCLT